eukprot:m.340973 g.340973  ORF g.340973 m.340973 type:complete len:777 (+) comp19678_c0_seq1:265-2595(+)
MGDDKRVSLHTIRDNPSQKSLTSMISNEGSGPIKAGTLQQGSAAVSIKALLDTDSEAYRTMDPANCSSCYQVRKVHSKMASIRRKNDVMMILNKDGMPAVLLITPVQYFRAWEKVRGKTEHEINELQSLYAVHGKSLQGWRESFPPREAQSKIIENSRTLELLYCDTIEKDPNNPAVLRFTMAPDGQGKERNAKGYELRPTPYVKSEAADQCTEVLDILHCGMLNAYLERPSMMDRPIKESATKRWVKGVQPHVNCLTPYGKSNLHHQVQVDRKGQLERVKDLLSWGADPNIPYGPTKMTALHMATSWRKSDVAKELLDAGADPAAEDVNGMTPLHLACIFGDMSSVEALVNTKKVDVNLIALTPLGSMRPLDCALECEQKVSMDIWACLQKNGADTSYSRDIQLYPPPFPRQSVSPFLGFLMTRTRNQNVEGITDVHKLRALLNMGMDPEDMDMFNRPALMFTHTRETTTELLTKVSDKNKIVPLGNMVDLSTHVVGSSYPETLSATAERLKKLAFTPDGSEVNADEVAPKMAVIIQQYLSSLENIYRRSFYSNSPLAQALTEGNLEKAFVLLDNDGVDEKVYNAGCEDREIDLTQYLITEGEQLETLQSSLGNAVWTGIVRKLLWFDSVRFVCPPVNGSGLLSSVFVADKVLKSGEKSLHQKILNRLRISEQNMTQTIPPGAYDATTTAMGQLKMLEGRCRDALKHMPMADELALQITEDETGDETINLAEIETRLRSQSMARGKLENREDWQSYRTRTMSFRRGSSEASIEFE